MIFDCELNSIKIKPLVKEDNQFEDREKSNFLIFTQSFDPDQNK